MGGAEGKEEGMKERLLTAVIYTLTTLAGVAAFLYPFWLPLAQQTAGAGQQAHAGDAPLVLTLLVGLAFVVLLLEVQSQAVSAKTVALLGVLVAVNALLRFAEVAVPGPGGFSPIFFLIVLTGYVFGARLGFLMGVLTLLVSAVITGSVGPWLPYQMFTAGWMGMAAALCRLPVRGLGWQGQRGEVALLALFGGLWGLLYGIIMNIWFWPFIAGPEMQSWAPGMGPLDALRRYAAFYVATSLLWDVMGLAGNVALIGAFGGATLKVLRRFHSRFAFSYAPEAAPRQAERPAPHPPAAAAKARP